MTPTPNTWTWKSYRESWVLKARLNHWALEGLQRFPKGSQLEHSVCAKITQKTISRPIKKKKWDAITVGLRYISRFRYNGGHTHTKNNGGHTGSVFRAPGKIKAERASPFIDSPARPLISVYFFFVVMWNSKRQHHHDCLVSLILWATLKKLLCDGLCERGALWGRTRTRKVQIRAHISLLPGLTQSCNGLTVSLAILQTKPSQAGFPARMNTDKWKRNPFWFGFYF